MGDRNNCTDEIKTNAIVIDPGSTMYKAGFAGDDIPRAIFRTVVGKPKGEHVSTSLDGEFYVGEDALAKRGMLTIRYPVEHGVVSNWDDIERVYYHLFQNELQVNPKEHPLLISEPPVTRFNPKTNREKLTQTLFEIFEIPALYIACQGELVLLDSGRKTGVVLDSGGEITNAIPVYEGHSLPYAVQGMDYGGRDVTETFIKQYHERGFRGYGGPSERRTAENVKEETCYVALDYEEELEKNEKQEYALSDCETILLENERFRATEVLFRSRQQKFRRNTDMHELICNSIMKCNPEIEKEMWANIVLAGGNTMFPGFCERLRRELKAIAPPNTEINVIERADRIHSGWRGGSIMASQSDFSSKCIEKNVYDEFGPSIVHRKCF